jgi:tryptophan-rich sensory protein
VTCAPQTRGLGLLGLAGWLLAGFVTAALGGIASGWSWLFFAWHQGALALADIVVLWLLIAGTIFLFWRLHRLAAVMLVPYLAWVSFAAALNFTVCRLNPSILG